MTHLTPHELLHEIEQAFHHLESKGEGSSLSKTLLHIAVASLRKEIENERKLDTILELLMPIDTTAMNQNYTDAKTEIVALAASHGTTQAEGQAVADDAATKFADLRDTAKNAIPVTPPAPPVTVAGT